MWDNLKASIASVVRTNNNQEITGANLQSVLNTIVNTVGANATFAGIAVPSTNPGTPDGPVFYIACEPGIYSNFNLTLVDGLYILENKTGSWAGTQINTGAAFEALIGYYNAVLNGASITVPEATTYRLTKGGVIRLKMLAPGTTATTLTIGNATDIPIWYNGAAVSAQNTWEANEIISVFYDGTRFMASNSQGGGGKAEKISYNNSQSGLASENVQEALDEVSENVIESIKTNLINPNNVDLSSITRNAKYIDVNNTWVSSGGAGSTNRNRSINVPVKSGEIYILTADATYGSIYALLKSNTSVGNPVDFSTSLNHRVVLAAGQKVVIEIPSDTTILYLFAYAQTTQNFLPSELIMGEKVRSIVSNIYSNITDKNHAVPNMDALEQVYKDESIDVFDTTTFLQYAKYINSSNVWAQDTSKKKARCILIPVAGGESYKIKADINFGSIYAFLRSNTTVGNPVDFSTELNHRVVLSAGQETVITIPDDTTILYMFVNTKGGDNFLPQSLVRLSKISNIAGQTYKTYSKGVMMGDSITAGVYSYFNGNQRWNGFQAGDGVSDYIGKIMNCPFDNVGKRGTGYVADTRDINNAWEQAQVTDFSQYDIVVMMYGVNDYIQGVTLGSIQDNIEGTVAGNMIRVFNKIFTDNPLCKVLCVGSYNTWGQVSQGGDYTSNVYYGDESTDYGLGYAISGNTLRDVLNLQKQVCEHFHVQYFCLADEGIVNTFNIKNVLVDGLHPTLELRKYIAQEIAKYLV